MFLPNLGNLRSILSSALSQPGSQCWQSPLWSAQLQCKPRPSKPSRWICAWDYFLPKTCTPSNTQNQVCLELCTQQEDHYLVRGFGPKVSHPLLPLFLSLTGRQKRGTFWDPLLAERAFLDLIPGELQGGLKLPGRAQYVLCSLEAPQFPAAAPKPSPRLPVPWKSVGSRALLPANPAKRVLTYQPEKVWSLISKCS